MIESYSYFNTHHPPTADVAMTDLPAYLEERIEPNSNRELQQRDVVEVMWESEQPYFTRAAVGQLVDGDFSDDAVNDRLNELVNVNALKLDVVGNTHLYYINRPESEWPVPSDVNLAEKGTVGSSNLLDLITLRDRQALLDIAMGQALTANGFLFIALTGGLAFGTLPISSENPLMIASVTLLVAAVFLLAVIKSAEGVREIRRNGLIGTIGGAMP